MHLLVAYAFMMCAAIVLHWIAEKSARSLLDLVPVALWRLPTKPWGTVVPQFAPETCPATIHKHGKQS